MGWWASTRSGDGRGGQDRVRGARCAQLADRFPAGQIFLPLHGHTPGQQPVDPADALASLLLTAGVAAAQIPPGLQARMALWRDRLAGQRLLLILDDAASSEQVRPLSARDRRQPGPGDQPPAPGRAGGRHRDQPGHPAARGVGRAAGAAGRAARLSPEIPAVGKITRLCGFLPLAIGMMARQLHHHPVWNFVRLRLPTWPRRWTGSS